MTSDPEFITPAHPGHYPIPLRFFSVDGGWMTQALCDLPIVKVEKAESCSDKAEAGYFRLTLGDGRLLFAKIKSGERASRESKAATLSSRLNRLGAATLATERTETIPEEGLTIFLYPWIDPAFYDESLTGLAKMGEALALLHSKMRALTLTTVPRKHLFDTWEDLLRLTPDTCHAEDYRRVLAGAGNAFARVSSQIAHNDIHRGNVLFKGSEVVAFIDFEDSVEANSSPLVDIAASLERFCLAQKPSEDKVRALLTGYAGASDGIHETSASEIVQVGLCRCYHAITILELSKAPLSPAWHAERSKFSALLKRWPRWGEILGGPLHGLRV